MKLAWKLLVIVCLIAAGGGYYWWKNQPGAKPAEAAAGKAAKAEGKGPGKRGGGGPVAVRTVQVSKQAMPQVIDVVGTVESEHSVAVRPQALDDQVAVLDEAIEQDPAPSLGRLLVLGSDLARPGHGDLLHAAMVRRSARLLHILA